MSPRRAALFLCLLAYGLALRLWHGPTLTDDAYITLRHSLHLAQAGALRYDLDTAVLGTTSPLFALLVAAGSLVTHSVESAAFAIGLLGFAASFLLLLLLARAAIDPASLAVTAFLFAAYFGNGISLSCQGMETTLFIALVLAAFLAYARDRPLLCGSCLALLYLARPDGLLFGATICVDAAIRRRGTLWRLILPQALVLMAWCAVSWSYYGQLLPNSIVAKSVVYADRPPGEALKAWARGIAGMLAGQLPGGRDLFVLARVACVAAVQGGLLVAGVPSAFRARELRPLLLGSCVYAIAHIAVGPITQPWYLGPVLPAMSIVLGMGYGAAWRRVRPALPTPAVANRVVFACASAAVVLTLFLARAGMEADRRGSVEREGAYRLMAAQLRPRLLATDVVAAPEIGVLGFETGGRILDMVGLVSPQVLPLHREAYRRIATGGGRFGDPDDDLDVYWRRFLLASSLIIERFQPAYIVAQTKFLPLSLLADSRVGEVRYRRIFEMSSSLGGRPNLLKEAPQFVIYQRDVRERAAPQAGLGPTRGPERTGWQR